MPNRSIPKVVPSVWRDRDGTITHLKTCVGFQGELILCEQKAIASVIADIKMGAVYSTVYWKDARWHTGARIRVHKEGNREWLQTDANGVGPDNLENLPNA